MVQKRIVTERGQSSKAKKTYKSPSVIHYGALRELTTSGSQNTMEMGVEMGPAFMV